MNSLEQNSSYLVGSEEFIKNLESKESAKLLLISDSHGNFNSVINAVSIKGSECDALLFMGDGLCDIAELFEAALNNSELMQKLPSVVGFVQGNGDNSRFTCYDKKLNQQGYVNFQVPLLQTINVCGHNFVFTHGHRYSCYYGTEQLSDLCQELNCDGAFYGHTHIARVEFASRNRMILNPGSISHPRGGQKYSFATVEVKKGSSNFDYCWWTFNGSGVEIYNPSCDNFSFF